MSAKKGHATPKQTLKFSNSPDYRSVYANWVQCGFTPYDMSVVVGEAYPNPEVENAFDVERKLRLILSPLEAKLVVGMLFATIRAFEEKFGTIGIPEEMAQQLKADTRPEGDAEGV